VIAPRYTRPLDPELARWFEGLDDNLAEMFQEIAAVREYEGGMPRRQAEALAQQDVLAWLRRRAGTPPSGD
jgi:hypothetical protein